MFDFEICNSLSAMPQPTECNVQQYLGPQFQVRAYRGFLPKYESSARPAMNMAPVCTSSRIATTGSMED
jgi:hypothetical protein